MADQKLSQLPLGSAIQSNDLFYSDQSGASVAQKASALATFTWASPTWAGTVTFPDGSTWTSMGLTNNYTTTFNYGAHASADVLEFIIEPIISGAAIGSFTFAHAYQANVFGDPRDNEIYGFGYNLNASLTGPQNAGDDAFGDLFVTEYNASAGVIQFQREIGIFFEKGTTTSLAPYSMIIQKWDSASPYYVSQTMAANLWSLVDPTMGNSAITVQPGSTANTTTLQINGVFLVGGLTNTDIGCRVNGNDAGQGASVQWQRSGVGYWRWWAYPSPGSGSFFIYDEGGGQAPLFVYSGGGVAVGSGFNGLSSSYNKGAGYLYVEQDLYVASGNFLIRSAASLPNGAGGNVGTLTTAPSAGNPTKWIPVDDDGTTRYIPAW
jgi:hypothetical protein